MLGRKGRRGNRCKPKKGADASDSDLPKIPSKLSNKDKSVFPDAPSFHVDSSLVSVDVAVLDSKGHFIPNIPKGNFRIQVGAVPIYAIGLTQALREFYDPRGALGSSVWVSSRPITRCVLSPRRLAVCRSFRGSLESSRIYQEIHQALRNQYSIAYLSTNLSRDGKFRKLTVGLVNPATNEPLRLVDEKKSQSNTPSSPKQDIRLLT